MPAPTALLGRPEALAEVLTVPLPEGELANVRRRGPYSDVTTTDGDDLLLETNEVTRKATDSVRGDSANDPDTEMTIDEEGRPRFAPAKPSVRDDTRDQSVDGWQLLIWI